jgi:hypothetical protein
MREPESQPSRFARIRQATQGPALGRMVKMKNSFKPSQRGLVMRNYLCGSRIYLPAIIAFALLIVFGSVSELMAGPFPTEVSAAQYGEKVFIKWSGNGAINDYESPFAPGTTFQVAYRTNLDAAWSTFYSTQNTYAVFTDAVTGVTYEFRVTIVDSDGGVMGEATSNQLPVQELIGDGRDDLGMIITSINAAGFPIIFLRALVDSAGMGIFSLDEENFIAYEDGVVQDSMFEVYPPTDTIPAASDIVFVFDVTGSMVDVINSLKANTQLFADSLMAAGINFRLGLVAFRDDYIMFNNGNLVPPESLNVFRGWINSLTATGGDDGPEDGFDALDAATTMNFRPGAQKVFILVTDAPCHYEQDWLCSNCSYSGDFTDHTQESIVDLLNANNVNCYVVGPDLGTDDIYALFCNMGSCWYYQYHGASYSLTEATGGVWYYILDDFRGIIEDLVGGLWSQYLIRYHTSNPICDGMEREVVLEVNDFGETVLDTAYYTPCMAPIVIVTDYTRALESSPQPFDVALTIDAYVIDRVAPFPTSVQLHYRTTASPSYSTAAMVNVSDSLWRSVIPAGVVIDPGVDYYVTATDGVNSGSAPSIDPSIYPYQIAVLPNVAPIISHTVIETPHPMNVPVEIDADVYDNTQYVDLVELYYRRYGDIVYLDEVMTGIDYSYAATIPAWVNYEYGFEYYIRAVDNYGLASYHGDADFPHQVNVGAQPGPEPDTCRARIIPDLIYKFYQYHIPPMSATIHLGNFEDGYTADRIMLSTVRVNNTVIPTQMTILSSYPGFDGEVLEIVVTMQDFIESYPLLWDTDMHTFDVSGWFTGKCFFSLGCEVMMVGHTSGDVDGDGAVSIVDATYLINFLYENGPVPKPRVEVADVNSSGDVNILDIIYLLRYLFMNGPKPSCPQTNY